MGEWAVGKWAVCKWVVVKWAMGGGCFSTSSESELATGRRAVGRGTEGGGGTACAASNGTDGSIRDRVQPNCMMIIFAHDRLMCDFNLIFA